MDISGYLAPAVVSAVGSAAVGTAAVVATLKFIKDRLAKAVDTLIAEKIKETHDSAIATVKHEFDKERAILQANIEKQIERNKFDLAKYGDLWESLAKLREVGNALWYRANLPNLRAFQTELRKARVKLTSLSYLLTYEQYEAMKKIIEAIEQFNVGKEELLRLRDVVIDDGFSFSETKNIIAQNEILWRKYNDLIDQARAEHNQYLSSLLDSHPV